MVSISVDYKYDMFIQCEMAPEAEMQGQGPHSAQGGRVGLRARSLGFEGQCVEGQCCRMRVLIRPKSQAVRLNTGVLFELTGMIRGFVRRSSNSG